MRGEVGESGTEPLCVTLHLGRVYACGSMPTPQTTPSPDHAPVIVRPIRPEDPIPAITALLHRAYAKQVAMGLKPLAGRQDDSITRERAANSECYLALMREPADAAERVVGVILFEEHEKVTFPSFFLRPEVAHFAQFGVDPDLQGRGIGRMLLEQVERRARENKAVELACSMAEPDTELFNFYIKRGYRLVDHWQWPYTNYRSCILSKPLTYP
jgi:GNAT superfamily N-acetyltransferase